MNSFFPFIFVAMSFFFLFIGIKVVLSKKPLFIPSRYFFVFMVLAFSPVLINSFTMFSKEMSGSIKIMFYISPLIIISILVFQWFLMKGYMAIGISDDSFRQALHFSLTKNNLPFEEQLSTITLTSIDANLQVAIQSWVGTGQIKFKKSGDPKILSEIVTGINQYYSENDIKPNNITAVFYIVTGILMLALAAVTFNMIN
ncbi:MAG: hypothetical protein FVQ82_10890 [Planctomycetes bacterium]|nr:hypothetical protein [Planctomycetota bacterium]